MRFNFGFASVFVPFSCIELRDERVAHFGHWSSEAEADGNGNEAVNGDRDWQENIEIYLIISKVASVVVDNLI